MKYRVTIGYMDFIFGDRYDALDFAEQAMLHAEDESRSVEVKLIKEAEDVGM